jgi:hypothetical protein
VDAGVDPVKRQPPRGWAAEKGLASALLGATVFLASPMIAILAAQVWAHGNRTPDVVLLHAWLARVAFGVPFFLVASGVWLGADGVRHARRTGQSCALPIAGLLLNAAGMCGWILAGIGLLNTTESMLWLER